MFKLKNLCAALCLFPSIAVQAANPASNEADLDFALEDLLKTLEQETQIATKSKLNIDFVPGMVSVLQGKDLLARGAHTLAEALSMVPGVQLSLAPDGQNLYIFRGIGSGFSSGKIKFLLNGNAYNAALSAASTFTIVPLEVVDRIEIIRGPGSSIYGEFAYAGVVNIITKKDANETFYRHTSSNNQTLGVSANGALPEQHFKWSLNLVGDYQQGDEVSADEDWLAANGQTSNTPGKSNEIEKNLTAILKLNIKDWDILVQRLENQLGDYFGLNNTLPPERKIIRKVHTDNISLSKSLFSSADYDIHSKLAWTHYNLSSGKHVIFPQGALGFPEDIVAAPFYEETQTQFSLEASLRQLEKHLILTGLDVSYTEQSDTKAGRNYNINAGSIVYAGSYAEYTGDANWLTENNSRLTIGAYVQDQFQASDNLTLTGGIRFDHYDDIDNIINPRIASVYNLNDRHIFKFQYAEAFRPPTFVEMYSQNNAIIDGNANIEPETISTVEAGYIYHSPKQTARATVFYSRLKNLISESAGMYENINRLDSRGVELEGLRQLNSQWNVNANLSATYIKDKSTSTYLPGIAKLYGMLASTYKPNARWSITATVKHIGKRSREAGDPRDDLDAYNTLNLSTTLHRLNEGAIDLQAGVNNVLAERIVQPAKLTSLPNGTLTPAYTDDYPRPGRFVWASLYYKF